MKNIDREWKGISYKFSNHWDGPGRKPNRTINEHRQRLWDEADRRNGEFR
jgi:hypothetical protein